MTLRSASSFSAALIAAAAGVYLLQTSQAATLAASMESETGQITGNAAGFSDATASGSRAVRFGQSLSTAPTAFGTLMTDMENNQTELNAGVKVAMVEFEWNKYEPGDGQFDASYIKNIKNDIDGYTAAGRRVTLAIGLYSAPSWIRNIPNARYVNESGEQSSFEDYNMVFNQKVRDKADVYFARLNQDLDLSRIWAIRLTSGSNGEMIYPDGGLWGYDVNAKNGPDMPPTMPRNPVPDFSPGSSQFTTAQARQWADWYVGALGNVTDWQEKSLSAKGFRGYFEALTPGAGVKPSYYNQIISGRLADPGPLANGAVWQRYYQSIPAEDRARTVAYSSSTAENSEGPGNGDSCQANDKSVAINSTAADDWSAARWISRIGDEYGMLKGGENPGYGLPANPAYTDASSSGMMSSAMRYASTCKFHVFYWAHDFNLFDGTVQFSDYAKGIKTVTGGNNPLPPMP